MSNNTDTLSYNLLSGKNVIESSNATFSECNDHDCSSLLVKVDDTMDNDGMLPVESVAGISAIGDTTASSTTTSKGNCYKDCVAEKQDTMEQTPEENTSIESSICTVTEEECTEETKTSTPFENICDQKQSDEYKKKVGGLLNEMQILIKSGLLKANPICSICGRVFKNVASLKTHIWKHKENCNLHKCNICNRTFKSNYALSGHLMLHTGKKPFECQICGNGFTRNEILKRHLITVHEGKRPFICEICGRGYKQKAHLTEHEKIHTGEGAYLCQVCGKAFTRQNKLNRHMNTHSKSELTANNHLQKSLKIEHSITYDGDLNDTSNVNMYLEKNESEDISATRFSLEENRKENSLKDCFEVDGELVEEISEEEFVKGISESISASSCDNIDTVENIDRSIISKEDLKEEIHEDVQLDAQTWFESSTTDSKEDIEELIQEMRLKIKSGQIQENPICSICGKVLKTVASLKTHLWMHKEVGKVFKCKVCDKIFKSRFSLKGHIMLHTGDKPYDCKLCGNTFTKRDRLNRHMRTVHDNNRPFICELCGNAYKQSGHLKEHLKAHTGEKAHICYVCGKGFGQGSKLNKHVKTVHRKSGLKMDLNEDKNGYTPVSRQLKCEICGVFIKQTEDIEEHVQLHALKNGDNEGIGDVKITFFAKCHCCDLIFDDVLDLREHVKTHDTKEVIKCDICEKQFSRKEGLKFHMNIHTGNVMHACEICGKCFVKKDRLKRHLLSHTDIKPHGCEYCGQSFQNVFLLREHLIQHTGKYPLNCNVCGKGFLRPSGLKQHKKCHEGTIISHCGICGAGFSSNTSLTHHEKQHLIAEKEVKFDPDGISEFDQHGGRTCNLCGFEVDDLKLLKDHIKEHRQTEYTKCDVCYKEFKGPAALRQHKLTHSTETNCQCDVCGVTFCRAQDLTKHRQSHQDKDHMCSVCGRRFKSIYHLRQHEPIHAEDKPYKCGFCDRGFHRKWDMKSHENLHTSKEFFQCPDCNETFFNEAKFTCHRARQCESKNEFMKNRVDTNPNNECTICGKTFKSIFSLRSHVGQHSQGHVTVAKEYICESCGKCFGTSSHLNRHVKNRVCMK